MEKLLSLRNLHFIFMKNEYICPKFEIVDITTDCCLANSPSSNTNDDYDYEEFEWK